MDGVLSKRLLLFDASDCTFRNIKLRDKLHNCVACGIKPTISDLIDYEQFCGAKANDKDKRLQLLSDEQRTTAGEYHAFTRQGKPFFLIDVRSPMEFEICHLTQSENIPIDNFSKESYLNALQKNIESKCKTEHEPYSVFVVCRRGNDSQKAVVKLQEKLKQSNVSVKDIVGGLHAWAQDVDPTFPVY